MSMSDIRKKAQDKLRRKYKYSTNDNYGRGTILYKTDPSFYRHKDGYNTVYDMNIVMDNNISWHPDTPIEINITKYRDNGENAPEGKRYDELGTNGISISLEELDLIHTIAHQMSEENNWQKQIKDHKTRMRKRGNV